MFQSQSKFYTIFGHVCFFQQIDADCEILAEKSRTPLGPWALKW